MIAVIRERNVYEIFWNHHTPRSCLGGFDANTQTGAGTVVRSRLLKLFGVVCGMASSMLASVPALAHSVSEQAQQPRLARAGRDFTAARRAAPANQ